MSIAKQFHNISTSAIIQSMEEEFVNTAANYVTAMSMAIKETSVFDKFESSLTNIRDITLDSATLVNHTDMLRDLLRPLSYLEEQTKMMGLEAIGKDSFSVTAFSAIHAIESQFKFHNLTQEAFLKTPLYGLLSEFDGLYPENFETEEDWYDEFSKRFKEILDILDTNVRQGKKHSLDFMNYVAQNRLKSFIFVVFTVVPAVITISSSISPDTKLLEQVEKNTQILEDMNKNQKKSHNCSFDKLPSSEIRNLYRVINDIEVKSEPSEISYSMTTLDIDTSVKVSKKQDDGWVQIECFDYISLETKNGWIKIDDVEPIVTDEEETAPTPLRLAEASTRIHERYAKTFQRLADE